MNARNPMLRLACLSQMERKSEWKAYSSSIKTEWTLIVAKKQQTLRAWKTFPVLKISRIIISAPHGNCISYLTRGHGEVFGPRTRFGPVHVLSVPSLGCMVECRKGSDCSPFFPLLSQTNILCSRMCCCSQSSIISVAAVQSRAFTSSCSWTEGAAMQGLSPAHPSGFHTAAFPLRHGIVLCEEDEALNMNIKMHPKSEIKSTHF